MLSSEESLSSSHRPNGPPSYWLATGSQWTSGTNPPHSAPHSSCPGMYQRSICIRPHGKMSILLCYLHYSPAVVVVTVSSSRLPSAQRYVIHCVKVCLGECEWGLHVLSLSWGNHPPKQISSSEKLIFKQLWGTRVVQTVCKSTLPWTDP